MSTFIFILLNCISAFHSYGEQPTARVIEDYANFRSCPDLACDVILQMNKGDKVKILKRYYDDRVEWYGLHPWYLAEVNGKKGFVYGAVISAFDDTAVARIGHVFNEKEIELRSCPGNQCQQLAIIPAALYLPTSDHSNKNWIKVKYYDDQNSVIEGFVSKKEVKEDIGFLMTKRFSVPLLSSDRSQILAKLKRGKFLEIISRSEKSEVIHPFGRNYWYYVKAGSQKGWIFGGYTSKEEELVYCQCVDYVKQELSISGPTAHAKDWGRVLTGSIPVMVSNNNKKLNYQEVTEPRTGDIVVLDEEHPQSHILYGHIGIIKYVHRDSSGVQKILVTGANHKSPLINEQIDGKCKNVSEKWYTNYTATMGVYRKQ